jgi:hypothetical protein
MFVTWVTTQYFSNYIVPSAGARIAVINLALGSMARLPSHNAA